MKTIKLSLYKAQFLNKNSEFGMSVITEIEELVFPEFIIIPFSEISYILSEKILSESCTVVKKRNTQKPEFLLISPLGVEKEIPLRKNCNNCTTFSYSNDGFSRRLEEICGILGSKNELNTIKNIVKAFEEDIKGGAL
jgi:hypothetical protein